MLPAGVVCLFALFAGGCIGVKVPITVAALAGLSLGVTFADLAAGCTRQTRLVLRIAIATGCCGCATLVVVGATGRVPWRRWLPCASRGQLLVLVAMHAAPIQSRQGQALKVIGSACCSRATRSACRWHEAPPAGMIGGSMAEALHGPAGCRSRLVGGGLLVAYAAAVVAAASRAEARVRRSPGVAAARRRGVSVRSCPFYSPPASRFLRAANGIRTEASLLCAIPEVEEQRTVAFSRSSSQLSRSRTHRRCVTADYDHSPVDARARRGILARYTARAGATPGFLTRRVKLRCNLLCVL